MSLGRRWTALRENKFFRSVMLLLGGTAVGQLVMISTLPLLTRLYSPEDFKVLGVYSGLLMIISQAACLRLDVAVLIPESDKDAINLLALALFFATIVSFSIAIPVVLMSEEGSVLFGIPQLRHLLWMLPMGVFLAASYNALQYWFSRKKMFGLIANTRIAQAIGGSSLMVGLGWAGLAPLGLLVGQMVASGAGVVGLAWRAIGHDRRTLKLISLAEMRQLLHRYARFPKYSALETLANNAAIQLPVIMIAVTVAGPETGFLVLSMRVMQAPLVMIGGAVSQVYASRAPEEYRAGTLGTFTASIVAGLIKSGVGPLLFAGITAPDVFSLVFGAEWRRSGVLVAWMTPWFILQFLTSPISMALHVTNNHKVALGLQVSGLFVRVGSVVLAATLIPACVAEAYALSGCIFYGFYFTIVLALAPVKLGEAVAAIRSGLVGIASWCLIGVSFLYVIRVIS